MTDREAACRALAGAMGWEFQPRWLMGCAVGDPDWFVFVPGRSRPEAGPIPIPAPDAPLHEQLSFVGQLAEAVGCADDLAIWLAPSGTPNVVMQGFSELNDDLVLAAIQAAIRVKGGGR